MLTSESVLMDGIEGICYSDEELMKNRLSSGNNFRLGDGGGEVSLSSELFEIKLEVLEVEVEVGSGNMNKEDDDYDCEGSWFSFDYRKWNNDYDCVYVGVGDNIDSSMDALRWTLKYSVLPSTVVYLLHVFPQIRFIPSPLGLLPREQVRPRVVEKYEADESAKRWQFLHKFVHTCSAAQVKAEVLMIQSDMVAKAILDLIPVIHIRKLILGSSKARKWRSKRRGIAKQILQNADEYCEVKIICEGKEATCEMIKSSSCSSNKSDKSWGLQKENGGRGFLSRLCFGF